MNSASIRVIVGNFQCFLVVKRNVWKWNCKYDTDFYYSFNLLQDFWNIWYYFAAFNQFVDFIFFIWWQAQYCCMFFRVFLWDFWLITTVLWNIYIFCSKYNGFLLNFLNKIYLVIFAHHSWPSSSISVLIHSLVLIARNRLFVL